MKNIKQITLLLIIMLLISQLIYGQKIAYMRSTVGTPWENTNIEEILNSTFGEGNWQDLRYETVNVDTLLSSDVRYIYMEGSDVLADELESFLTTHIQSFENWVQNGGVLFINAGAGEGNGMNLGFGGIELIYPNTASSVLATNLSHPVFNEPYIPVGTAWTGSSFSTASVSGLGLIALIVEEGNESKIVLAEKDWGKGKVFFGGMTTSNFHNQVTQSENLRKNILSIVVSNGFNDAGISEIKEPNNFSSGNHDIVATLKNFGRNIINNVNINWEFNGELQTVISYTIPLDSIGGEGQNTVDIVLGNKMFEQNQTYNIKVWTSSPNGEQDTINKNDTVQVILKPLLGLNYTIGGTSPDFTTFREAISTIKASEICGPVVFNIRSGNYNEQLILREIIGVSETNTITFQSETGNSSDVVISYASNDWGNNFTVKLDGADHVIFKDLTIEATGVNYGTVIEIINGAKSNQFLNNLIKGVIIDRSNDAFTVISGYDENDNNIFDGNNIMYGNIGISMINTTDNPESGIVIRNNKFTENYYMAVYLSYQKNAQITSNTIINTIDDDFYALYFDDCEDSIIVTKNKINIFNDGYGIYMHDGYSNNGSSLVANNFISIEASMDSYGIYSDNTSGIQYIHNNVLITRKTGNTYDNIGTALGFSDGAENTILNNIFINETGGYAIGIWRGSVFNSDYNNLYSTGDYLAYFNDNAANLSEWQAISGMDSNSISINPLFLSTNDLHVKKGLLDGKALPSSIVTDDIDGEIRNIATPDIGADEFDPIGEDATLVSIGCPKAPFAAGLYDINVTIKNSGINNLTDATIYWEVNGIGQTEKVWSGDLSSGNTTSVFIGNYNFENSTIYNMRVWIADPNGSNDIDNSDDTLLVSNIYTELSSGVYTIGGVSPDFTTLNDAAYAINYGGINGSVIFNIRDGSYNEQLLLLEIPEADSINTVTFQSESGDSAVVVISYAAENSNNYVIKLDGSDYITFKDITFKSLGTTYSRVIELANGATNNLFTNNIIEGVSVATTNINNSVIHSGGGNSNDNNNSFIQNIIKNGSIGLSFYGYGSDAPEKNLVVLDNTFENQYYMSVLLMNQHAPIIKQNNISTNSTYTYFRGVHLANCYNNILISGNRINIPVGNAGIYTHNIYGNEDAKANINNNFIYVGGSNTAYGIYVYYAQFLNIYHNNINIASTNTSNSAVLYVRSEKNISVLNNIFVNSGGGNGIYYNNSTSIQNSDYNNIFVSGTQFGNCSGVLYQNLDSWKKGTSFDEHSYSVNPFFTSDTDLHIKKGILNNTATPVIEVTEDIDGEIRNTTTPDIGADEFAPTGVDASLVYIEYSDVQILKGIHPVRMVIKNGGGEILTSATINWSINDTVQAPYNWNGTLANGEADTINLADYNFEFNTAYDIAVSINEPNGVVDIDTTDNFLVVEDFYVSLEGTYTIGGTTPDFNTFQEAVNVLNNGGVYSSIVFNVRDGSYNEQISINELRGSSSTNTVTFQSESGDSTAVTLYYNSTNSSSNYTIRLAGADYISFKNLTLKADNVNYGRVIDLRNGSNNNQFLNNKIEGANTTSTSSNTAVIYSERGTSIIENNNNTHIKNNIILNGSYGVYYQGYSYNELQRAKNLLIENNSFENQYYVGIYVLYHEKAQIKNNTITTNSLRTYFMGIYACYNYDIQTISNKISIPNGGYGIYFSYSFGSVGNECLIANNFIVVGGVNVYTYGIYLRRAEYTNLFHNTINITTTQNAKSCALYVYGGTNNSLINNIFTNTGDGYAISINSIDEIASSDYNDFYVKGNYIAALAGNPVDLSAWQNTTGFDANSLLIDPRFISETDLHVREIALYNTGSTLPSIVKDIDGELRDASPDIGADEFTPASIDVGAYALVNPVMPFDAGEQMVSIVLRNFGLDTVNSVDLYWSINDTLQEVVNWNDTLISANNKIIQLGAYTFDPNVAYKIKAWTKNPNGGGVDADLSNDTVTLVNQYPGLKGTYTIGGTTPDFNTFQEAVNVLNNGGVLSSVVFNVRDGSYNEQISINELKGTSSTNTVTFQSESGDSTAVTLYYNSTNSSSNYTVRLAGADYISFKNLTLKAVNASYARVIDLRNGSNNNQFLNSKIEGVNTTSSSSNTAVIYSEQGTLVEENNNNINIKNNIILNGSYGMYYQGYSYNELQRAKNLLIENNSFENQYYQGIYVLYHEKVWMKNNTITTNSLCTYFIGIYACNNYDSVQIISNKISIPNGGYGIYWDSYGLGGNEYLIANNFIAIGGVNVKTYGIYLEYAKYINLFHNTINITTTQNAKSCALYEFGGTGNSLINNIFTNSGDGYAIYVSSNYGIASSDYNDFYVKGNYIAAIADNLVDLSAWQSTTGFDANSLSIDPRFISETDLHVREIALYNTGSKLHSIVTDIDGELRDASPDIGADEFTPESIDVGAYALANPVMPFEAGEQMVSVVLRNFGLDTLNSVELYWSINDTLQEVVNWNDTLISANNKIVQLGAYTFDPNVAYKIKAWTKNPNGGGADADLSNDTVTFVNQYTGLNGIYTIGGTTPDFDIIKHAVNAIILGGVVDSVIFNIRAGTYNEQLLIPQILGSSSYNKVIFQAESGNKSDVSVIYNANSTDNYTIRLDGADGITFRNMSIGAGNSTYYGIVVDIRNSAEYNTFNNVILNGINRNSTSTELSVIYSPGYNDNYNKFQNSQINEGSHGFYFHGYTSSNREYGNLIENNIFKNQYACAISAINQEDVQINKNYISTNSVNNYYKGIYVYNSRNNIKITGNKICSTNGGYGIYLYYIYGTNENRSLVANNFIQLGGTVFSRGMYISQCYYTNIYHNNINITNTSSNFYNNVAISISRGSSYDLRNNIFVNSGNGYAIYYYNIGFTADYNNLFTTGNNLTYYNNKYLNDLAAWQSTSGKDQHSVSVDPFYYSKTDLHVYNTLLNAAAEPLIDIKDDIDGDTRSLTPDIGADEFISSTEDAGISSIDAPVNSMKAGYNNVYVQLLNNASAELNSVSIFCTINEDTLPTYNWNGVLASGERDSVKIGTYEFLPVTEYEIVAWTSQPNGLTDKLSINDTVSVSGLYAGMVGTYFIGGDTADFQNFTQAAQAINERGVAGNVVFKIADGIYNEQITINDVSGLSEENQITFESASGDKSKVTLTYATTSAANYTLHIKGADYLNFKNMTIGSTGEYYGRVVEISDEADYLNFNNVVFNGVNYEYYNYADNRAIIYTSYAQNQFNTFRNCIFSDGGYAIYYRGKSSGTLSSGTIIENNIFEDQYVRSIYLVNQFEPKVNNNNIVTFPTYSYCGIHFEYCDGCFEIKNNKIDLNGDGSGIKILYSDGSLNNNGKVVNNFVHVGNASYTHLASYARGIYTSGSRYIEIFHNNVNIISTNVSLGRAYSNSNGENIKILNNVFTNSGGGYAYYNETSSAITQSDYNDLYTSGVNLAFWTTNQVSLDALKTASGFEANSFSVDPQFISASDLHINQPNLDGAATPIDDVIYDIDGQLRHKTTPDIGADEFGTGLITNDIGVVSVMSPESACELSDSEIITVRVQNHGVNTISTFDITYIVNDEIVVTETVEDFNLQGGHNKEYSFTNPLNMEKRGYYDFVVYTSMQSDTLNLNDTLSNLTIEHYSGVTASVSNDITICNNTTAYLVATGGSKYQWGYLGYNGIINNGSVYYASPSSSTTYVVTVLNNYGCSDKDTVVVDVLPSPEIPDINVIGSVTTCNDDTIRLESSIPDNIIWSTGEVTQSIQIFKPGWYNVKHTDTITGCSSAKSIRLSYAYPPSLSVSDYSICEGSGQSVTITVNNGSIYTWSTGEVTQSIKVTPTETTKYSVVIVNNDGCEYTRTATISVKPYEPAPEIYSISNDTEVCSGSPVTLSVSGNANSYRWSNGMTGNSIRVNPTSNTTYTVTAENGECGMGIATESVLVTVLSLPDAPIIVATGSSNLSFCDADSIKLLSSVFSDSILWSTGETTQEIITTYPGIYSVNHIDEYGCSNSTSVTLTDPPIPYIIGKNTVCGGESTILTVNNGDFYLWSTGHTTRSIEVTPIETTTYSVNITNKEGCTYMASIQVTILPMPKISSISSDITICSGEEVMLNVSGTADRFIWTDGQEGSSIIVKPSETTTYRVTATNGCTLNKLNDYSKVTVNVQPLPDKPIINPANTIVICEIDSVELTSSETNNIIWSTGETTQTIFVKETGDYVLTHYNEFGCTLSDQVAVIYTPKPFIEAQGFETICRDDSITLSVKNALSYNWSTGEITKDIVVSPLDTTIYSVSGNNMLGCHYSSEITINIIDPMTPYIVGNLLPNDNDNELSLPLSLSWAPSNYASHYDIYIWEDSTEIPEEPYILNHDQISYIIKNSLEYGQNYKYQVNAKNSCHITEGNSQTFIMRELPDLVIKNIKTPKSAFSGQSIDISWDVENTGKGNTIVNEQWNDAVYLSSDSTLDINYDRYLGGISNLTALNSGQSYSKTSIFTLPKGITGEYYVFVVADKFHSVKESDEDNNIQRGYPSMLVYLTPPPDLQVEQIVIPNNVFSGQQIEISWTVKNKGTGITETDSWRDRVYLSSDSLLRTSTAINLGTFSHKGHLEPEDEYTIYKTVTVPNSIYGNYFIYVKSDIYDNLFEHAFENNNVGRSNGMNIILAPPPDLTVTEISMQDSASNKEYINISWTVKNQGGSPTDGTNWVDKIYISGSTTFNNSNAKQIDATYNYQNLDIGETYTRTKQVRIPNEISGSHYIYIHTDVDNKVFEYENENNNLIRSSSVIEILSPDIVVSRVHMVDSAISGELIEINWVVKNVGKGKLYNSNCEDRISSYYSAIFNAESVIEIDKYAYISGDLFPGDSINLQTEVKLPEGIYGKNYIHIEADAENVLYEQPYGERNNNYGSLHIMLSLWADLEVTDIQSYSDTVNAGSSMPFQITVSNTGYANTKESNWIDKIYISRESEITEDTVFIKQFERAGGLLLDSSYLIDTKVKLLADLSEGEYYFHIFTDYEDKIYEHTDEENNLTTYGPVYINTYPPVDLTINTVTVADTVFSGQEYDIQWVVKNIGLAPSLTYFWYDALYLSKDSIWNENTDLYLTEWPVLGPIGVMEEFNEHQLFTVPDGLSGDYYLMMVADHSNNSDTMHYTIDNNRDNNLKMLPIHIELTPSPDLQITNWNAPNQGVSGQPIRVQWTVTNEGVGATNKNWTDKIYLSTDLNVDEDDDISIYIKSVENTLQVGESYSYEADVTIPMSTEGNYIILIKTDNNDVQYEHNAEDNNTASSLITVTRPLPADLVVSNIVIPDSAKAGKLITVEWTVENTGINPAVGVMQEIVYFSEDETWDINDAVLGNIEYNINLAPLSTITKTLNAQLNNVKIGEYYVIVKTDSRNNIYENDDNNNEMSSSNKVNVNVDELKLYTLTYDILNPPTYIDSFVYVYRHDLRRYIWTTIKVIDTSNSQNTYYRIEIPDSLNNETLLLTLNSEDDNGNNELYIKYGELPTRNDYDDAFDKPFAGDQEVVIPNLIPGTYYVLVCGSPGNQSIELYACILNFEIRSIETNEGGNTGSVTTMIEGAKFSPELELFLERGDTKIYASKVQFIDPAKIYATFDLLGAELGYYNVVAVDKLENIAILYNGFSVVQGTNYLLETNYEYPHSTRPGNIVQITLQFANGGNIDIPAPTRSMISLFGAPVAFLINDLSYQYKDLYIEFKEPGGPEGVLRPGAISSVTVYTKAVNRLRFKLIK